MLSAIRSSQRPTTVITRVTAALPDLPHALPDLPHPHRKRHRRVGTAAIVGAVAGLVAVLIVAAVIFRDKLASVVSRGEGGEEEQAPHAAQE